ncbi:MAG: hypothetical protein ABR543_14595 [Gemmatimonadaceae bacterium]
MNEFLRDRILRKVDTLPDDKGYAVLDYVEFLESRYAEKDPALPGVFQRFAEGVEDTMRAGRISAATVAETMGLLNRAMNVLSGVAAAGKSVANDVVGAATRTTNAQQGQPSTPQTAVRIEISQPRPSAGESA